MAFTSTVGFFSLYTILILFGVRTNICRGDRRPDLMVAELEHLLVDFDGANAGLFGSGITPCSFYFTGAQTRGQETAAQWVRAAFHDAVTADVVSGTGGVDGSIGYETSSPENLGPFLNDSLLFFSFFQTDQLSISDLIALGVVTAVGACGGPIIPLRGGRIDATKAGPLGVPLPESDIETTLHEFSSSGFDQSDAIALTACGHTLGGVHHSDFPNVVTPDAVTSDNTDGREQFDDTPAVFDIRLVNQYLEGTGQRGGPLVTTSNITVQSDLRLYLSDHNETMKSLAQSPASFGSKCTSLFARMIDTVPKEVILSEPITPFALKAINTTIDIAWEGNMELRGAIRYLQESKPSESQVPILWSTRDGTKASSSITATHDPSGDDTGSGMFGSTYYYGYSIPFSSSVGISSFGPSNEFAVSDEVFWVVPLSSVSVNEDLSAHLDYNLTVAVRSSIQPSAVSAIITVPNQVLGTVNRRLDRTPLALKLIGTAGQYSLYSATASDITEFNFFQASFDIVAEGGGAGGTFTSYYNKMQNLCPDNTKC